MIDPRLLDPEKVFEDGFLLTKMIDELTAEVQNPYKGRRMRSNLQDDIQGVVNKDNVVNSHR